MAKTAERKTDDTKTAGTTIADGRSAATAPTKRRPREAAPKARPEARPTADQATADAPPTKLSILIDLLARAGGASIAEMSAATGWQAHSVRGAMAGALRKRGHAVVSSKAEDGARRYRIEGGA